MQILAAALGEHFLEIGFGTGHVLIELANAVGPTGRVFGIDISENTLAHAKGAREDRARWEAALEVGDGRLVRHVGL